MIKREMALLVVLVMVLNGCAGPAQQGGGLGASDAVGCAVGVGLGALSCMLLQDAGARKKCMIAATPAGCVAGVGVNQYSQYQRRQYAGQEQDLQRLIAALQQENQQTARLLLNAQQAIVNNYQKIEAIDQAYNSQQISLAQAQAQLRVVDNNQQLLQQALSNLKSREQYWQQVGAQNPNPELNREIIQLRSQIASFEQQLRNLVERRNVSAVG